LKVDETIEEAYFYRVHNTTFYVLINMKAIYKFSNLKLTEKVPIAEGFFFEPVLVNNKLYSDHYGEHLIV